MLARLVSLRIRYSSSSQNNCMDLSAKDEDKNNMQTFICNMNIFKSIYLYYVCVCCFGNTDSQLPAVGVRIESIRFRMYLARLATAGRSSSIALWTKKYTCSASATLRLHCSMIYLRREQKRTEQTDSHKFVVICAQSTM